MSTNLISKVYNCIKNIQYLLLPGTCIICKHNSRRNLDICQYCESRLPTISKPCLRCALPLPPFEYNGNICGACISGNSPFHHTISAFDYRPPLNHLIANFKYQAKLNNGRVLSDFLLLAIRRFYQTRQLPELIIPVPLHRRKLRQRGFNQSIEIARTLSRQLDIPMNNQLCIRHKDTLAQMKLSALERKKNLYNAFSLIEPNSLSNIKRIAIVDDVVTTMATSSEISKLLLKNGTQEIHLWCLARTCK